MMEKHEGIWLSVKEDGLSTVVSEIYIPEIDKIHLVYKRADGNYMPYSYTKEKDPQWRLPIWSKENGKTILPTLQSAKEYLLDYGVNNT